MSLDERIEKCIQNWRKTKDREHLRDISRVLDWHEVGEVIERQNGNPDIIRYNGRNIEVLNTADIDGREGW